MMKALLILHGFAGNPKEHNKLITYLKKNSDIEPFIFTMPGHKEAEICKAKEDDYLEKAEDELQKVIALGYEDITVYGYSMGGAIATYLGTLHPEITRLIIGSPAYALAFFKKTSKSKTSKKSKKVLLKDNAKMGAAEFLKRFPLKAQIEFLKLIRHCDMSIKALNKPTLYLHGSDDQVASKEASLEAFNLNKNTQKTYLALDEANHDIYASKWEELIYSLICRYASGEDLPLGYFANTDDFLKENKPKR